MTNIDWNKLINWLVEGSIGVIFGAISIYIAHSISKKWEQKKEKQKKDTESYNRWLMPNGLPPANIPEALKQAKQEGHNVLVWQKTVMLIVFFIIGTGIGLLATLAPLYGHQVYYPAMSPTPFLAHPATLTPNFIPTLTPEPTSTTEPTPTTGFTTSEEFVTAAWNALNNNQLEEAIGFAQESIIRWESEAIKQQSELTQAPPTGKVTDEEKKAIFANRELNSVGTAYFIKALALEKLYKIAESKEAYNKAITFPYARSWDPQGWFWSPAEAARNNLAKMP